MASIMIKPYQCTPFILWSFVFILNTVVVNLMANIFYGVSDYHPLSFSGNLLEPPTAAPKSGSKFTKVEKKTVRGKAYDSDSESDED